MIWYDKEITSIIKTLKTQNTYGFDEISIKILKISATYIRSPLTYICYKSSLSGIFPDHMKFSVIKPIYEKGNKMIQQTIGLYHYWLLSRRFLKKPYVLDWLNILILINYLWETSFVLGRA